MEKKVTDEALRRKRRVKTMKRCIIALMIIAIITPTIMCAVLMVRVSRLEKSLDMLLSTRRLSSTSTLLNQSGEDFSVDFVDEVSASDATADGIIQAEEYTEALANENVHGVVDMETYVEGTTVRKVYLTFDDGPSENTDAILDILKEYNIKATFFVIGREDEESIVRYNRILEEGHTLAMHSYTHNYSQIYADMDSYIEDVTSLQELLTRVTGVTPVFYRFPGGSSNTVSNVDIKNCIQFLEDNNIQYFDWNVSSGDASSRKLTAETIANNVINGINSLSSDAVVLMHDSGTKTTTVEALPIIIEQLQEMGLDICAIGDTTNPVHHTIR